MCWVAWVDFFFVDKKFHYSYVQLKLHRIQLSKITILVTIFWVIAYNFAKGPDTGADPGFDQGGPQIVTGLNF